MGYRNYLGSLPKREYNKIKKFTKEELYQYKNANVNDEYDYVGVTDICAEKYLHELGKYVDSFDKKFYKPVFKNKELQKEFTEENDFYIVQKEFVAHLINHYSELIRKYYKEMLTPFCSENGKDFNIPKFEDMDEKQRLQAYQCINHVRTMGLEWGVSGWFQDSRPYDLEREAKENCITTSWKYEYSIFQLIHIYRTFDWKRNVMIYYGF